ncbi:hypothetical protein RvY_16630 [Ramazzottius varieornatus]|uniref:BTB domain-containing protein n=1 Tax=Ramazzottius varieornatus TaxID=947166 RepID=A0A1D1W1W0_RAMVA|nr:hypothetical protein RvY_16630 [Ramazzottius varieornatus]
MFYGPNAKKNEDTIIIPNYTAVVFKIVLGFLYCDRIPDNIMTIDQLMDVLVCADQYGIAELSTRCRRILTDELRRTDDFGTPVPDTKLIYVLKKASETGNLDVAQAASEALFGKVKKFLYSAKVPSYESLYEFVKGTETQLEPKDEIKIYQTACRYNGPRRSGRTKCPRVLPRRTLRKIMGPLFQAIRFPLMSSAEIAEGPVKDGMFTLEEITALYRQQFSPQPAKPKPFTDAT